MKMIRNSRDASLLGEAGWLVFLWAMYGLICQLVTGGDLGVFKFSDKLSLFGYEQVLYVWMFELSAIMILFFTKPSLNIVDSLIAGLGSIASNASGMFSDILSYIRLWAVGLAGGKVASAFNSIGGIVASIPVIGVVIQIIIFVAGHLLNIALSCISVLAHAVRLNLLEFSSHLGLEWAGREYDPFKEKN
jgi:V/A-type H+-transporting ATPase subunit I